MKWTVKQDKELAWCMNWAIERDLPSSEGFTRATEELGRTYDDVYERWHRVVESSLHGDVYRLRKEIKWLRARISLDRKGTPIATKEPLKPINLDDVRRVMRSLEEVDTTKPGWGLELTEEQETANADFANYGYDWVRWLMAERDWLIWGGKVE